MADNDLGEMFLNFMLDVDIRPFAGVDLASLFPEEMFPEEMFPGVTELYTRCRKLDVPRIMGRSNPSSSNLVQIFESPCHNLGSLILPLVFVPKRLSL